MNKGTSILEPNELETVSCDLCGSYDSHLLTKRSRLDIPLNTVVCKGCGHIYHNPRLSKAQYNRFYEHDYRALMGEFAGTKEEFFQMQVTHGQSIYEFCSDFVTRKGKVLDIGCAVGGQLQVFRERHGCAVVGVEPGEEEAQFANDIKGIPVENTVFENTEFPSESFDLVIMTQVLNHLLNPRCTLERVWKVLKPSGVVFIEVQDFVHILSMRPIAKASTVDHPNMFYPQTLRALLKSVGFEPIRERYDRNDPSAVALEHGIPSKHMRVCARKIIPNPESPWPNWIATLREIKHNQRYRFRQVGLKHYVATGLRRVAGERGYQVIRAVYRKLTR